MHHRACLRFVVTRVLCAPEQAEADADATRNTPGRCEEHTRGATARSMPSSSGAAGRSAPVSRATTGTVPARLRCIALLLVASRRGRRPLGVHHRAGTAAALWPGKKLSHQGTWAAAMP